MWCEHGGALALVARPRPGRRRAAGRGRRLAAAALELVKAERVAVERVAPV